MTAASRETVELTRDCIATTVPGGRRTSLTAGDRVQVMQSLGESITVQTEFGALVRINGEDVDALGLDTPGQERGLITTAEPFSISQVLDALQNVYDPEIPVSVVELGLIYRCDEELLADGSRLISIDMSMTAPGCGMGDVLRADAERVVRMVAGVDDVEVTLVWDPPWNLSRMSEAVRLQLGLL
jgi:probable FeS assembly SUF system protein SufT